MIVCEIKKISTGRLKLIFDDGTELRTTLGAVMERTIASGSELSEAEYEELKKVSELSSAKSRALKLAETRTMSAKQLRDKLVEKGEDPEIADQCVEWLKGYGYIDDAEAAAVIVKHYAAKGYGAARVKQKLKRLGIDNELWDEALKEMPDQDEKLKKLIRERLSDPNDPADVRRVADALYRRGFSWSEIRHAINSFIAETEDFYQ